MGKPLFLVFQIITTIPVTQIQPGGIPCIDTSGTVSSDFQQLK